MSPIFIINIPFVAIFLTLQNHYHVKTLLSKLGKKSSLHRTQIEGQYSFFSESLLYILVFCEAAKSHKMAAKSKMAGKFKMAAKSKMATKSKMAAKFKMATKCKTAAKSKMAAIYFLNSINILID